MPDMPRRELSAEDQHRLRIARDTLRMPGAMAGVMGGMTKEEARRVVAELGPLTARGLARHGIARGAYDGGTGRRFVFFSPGKDPRNVMRHEYPTKRERDDAVRSHLRDESASARKILDRLVEGTQLSGGTQSLSWEELPNGDLKIKVDAETQAEIREKVDAGDTSDAHFSDVLGIGGTSCMAGNGFDFVRPDEIGALTDAPLIAYDVQRDDNGDLQVNDATKIWWYPGYQVRSPLQDLAEKGETVFTVASRS